MSELENPYAPPEADDVEPPASAGEFVVGASQGKRFVNMLIDSVASRVLTFAFALFGAREFGSTLAGLLSILFILCYYLFLELAFQATLGKLVTGTRVVALGGGRPTFMQILGRTLSRFVPFEPFSFFSGKHPVGWHDRWSNTRVVDKYTLNRLRL
jgi:uncharacterized RDD family membrane protein YckC